MKRITTLWLTSLFFSFLLHSQAPNVVIIIADDMGWSQVSTGLTNLNNPSDFYETPTLETLASEGIAFPYGYVNGANCAPTRSAMLSGQYASRPHNNIWAVDNLNRGGSSTLLVGPPQGLPSGIDEIPASAITIAETMKTAGYATVHLGKFHVGENESTNTSNNAATDQGFDFNYGGGTKGAPGTYFASSSSPYTFHGNIGPELDVYADPYTLAESIALSVNGDNALEGTPKHVTDAMADAAIDWMEANKNTPFFVHFSNFAIHGPFDTGNARPDLVAKYQAKPPSQMGHNSIGQAAIAEGMDQTIGRLIDYLKTTADPRNPGFMLSENTLVYFISDNGGAIGTDDNGPLRGMKGELYEGGIRSVTLAWSEASWLANKGTINTTPVIAFDLYPTLAELGGASLPGGGYDIDGESQWQMLTNGTAMSRESIFWHFPGYLIDSNRDQRPVSIIRKGDYKLIHNYETASYEMYNLINDISEGTNLLAGSPDQATLIIANDLSTDLRNHLINISAPLPTYRSNGQTVPLPYIIDTEPGGGGGALCEAPAGFEAYWNFDTANGANDASGNNHNPNPINGSLSFDTVDFVEGDQSVVFNGSTDIQYSSGSFLTAALTTRSYTIWIKPTVLSGLQVIMDEGGGNQGLGVRLNGSNIEAIVRSGTTNLTQISAAYPNDSDWHHVACVYDGGATSLKLYIDGVEVASDNGALSSVATHTGIGGIGGVIGGQDPFGETSDSYFTGKMDGYAVYNNALSLAQVEEAACLNQVVADAGPDVTICDGDSTMLTASGGDTYLWSTGATTASINVSPSSTTTYTVTAFVGGNSDDDDVIVTVDPVPTADAGSDVTICDGDTTTLTATGGDTYLWSTGATTASIVVSPSSTTVYTVTVTTNGCSDNDDVTVTVDPLPTADAGSDVTICEGDSTVLTATGGSSYLWNTGATTPSIVVSPSSTTIYTVTATQNGCSDNDSVTVTVDPAPIADAGPDVTICEGDSTTLTATGGDSYLWSTGATTASINVSPALTTLYTVTVSKNGCITTDIDDVLVTVNALPTANAGPDITICDGDSTTLTASGGDSYLWNTGATTASINVSPSSTTVYSVTVTTNGCSDNDNVTVTVDPTPTANAGSDQTICLGESSTLTATGGGSYLWSTGATTASINVSPTSNTTYTVTVTQNGCSDNDDVTVNVTTNPVADAGPDVTICDGDSTTLTASGGDTYLWSTGATTASIVVSPSSTTTYTVTASLNGCVVTDDDDVTVTVNTNPTADAGPDVTMCEGDSTTLTASGGGSYLWNTGATTQSINVSPSTTTVYTVTVTTNGCSDNDSVTVNVDTLPTADAGTDVAICEGDSTTLTATGGGTYLWSTGATTQSINVSPSSTTVYSVTVTQNGCSDNDSVTVTVNSIPTANASPDVTICDGDSTTLTASGGDSYLWNTGATTASINVSPSSTTVYSVTVTTNGCSDNDDVTVFVDPLPSADAGPDVTIDESNSTTLTATGGGSYLWSTGATTASIVVSPTETTVYSVTVTQNGCSDMDSVTVTVNSAGCTYYLIDQEGFEGGWGIWNDGGSDSRRSSNDAIYATTGTYCVRLRDDTDTSVTTTDNLDLSIFEEITVDFAYYPRSMDNSSEDFWLQISTNGGGSYTTVEEWNRDDEFVNNQFYTDQVVIAGPFTSTTRLRFRADASGNSDWVYLDDIVISGCSTSTPQLAPEPNDEEITPPEITVDYPEEKGITAMLYPNPFNNELNVRVKGRFDQIDIQVFNLVGQPVYRRSHTDRKDVYVLDIDNLPSGQYFVRLNIDGLIIYKQVLKK